MYLEAGPGGTFESKEIKSTIRGTKEEKKSKPQKN